MSSSTTLPGGRRGLWLLQGIPSTLPVPQCCEELSAPKGTVLTALQGQAAGLWLEFSLAQIKIFFFPS